MTQCADGRGFMTAFYCFFWRLMLCFAIVFPISGSLYAAKPRSMEVGISLMSYQMLNLTKSPSGKKDTMGTSFYHLALQYHQPVSRFLWSPWFRFMPEGIYAVNSPNGSSKTSILALGSPFTLNVSPNIDVATGPVIFRYTVRAFGSGTELQNNGESTAEFYQPNLSKSSLTLAWQVGASYSVEGFRASTDLLLHGLVSSAKRSFSLMLTGTWVKSL
jgi:hypothetical protein